MTSIGVAPLGIIIIITIAQITLVNIALRELIILDMSMIETIYPTKRTPIKLIHKRIGKMEGLIREEEGLKEEEVKEEGPLITQVVISTSLQKDRLMNKYWGRIMAPSHNMKNMRVSSTPEKMIKAVGSLSKKRKKIDLSITLIGR